jgi:hypothetical protein
MKPPSSFGVTFYKNRTDFCKSETIVNMWIGSPQPFQAPNNFLPKDCRTRLARDSSQASEPRDQPGLQGPVPDLAMVVGPGQARE